MNTHKNKFGIMLLLSLVVLLGLSGLANAQMMGPGMMGGPGGWAGSGYMYGMTPEKQAVAQKIYSEHYAATSQLRQQLFVKQSELNSQLYGGGTNDQKVKALTREIGDLEAKLLEAQVNLNRQLTKEGIPAMGMWGVGCGMGGGMVGGTGFQGTCY